MIGIHVPQSFSDILLFLAVIVSAQNATPPSPHTHNHTPLFDFDKRIFTRIDIRYTEVNLVIPVEFKTT
jgi:hypothetical protein